MKVLTSVKYGMKINWLGREKKSGPFIALCSFKSKIFFEISVFLRVRIKIMAIDAQLLA